MKNKLKLFVVAALMVTLGLSLTACGGKPAATDEKGGAVQLEMWVHAAGDSPDGKVYKERIEEFNKAHEGKINVKLLAIPRSGSSSGYEDRINAGIATKKLPDLITVDGPNVATYAEAGVLAPIDKYMDKADLADFMPSIITQGTYKNQLYHLGAEESTVVVYYNKAMFKAAGITAPTKLADAWTWDELFKNAKLLNKDGKQGLSLQMNADTEWFIYAFLPFVWSNGGDLVSADGLTAEGYLNGPKTTEALTFIGNVFKEQLAVVAPKPTDFEEGLVAMKFNGPWAAAGLKKYPDIEWGVMPYPVSPTTKKGVSPSGSWGFSMTAQSKHPAEAAEVLKWMTNTDTSVQMHKANGTLPSRKSALDKLEDLKQEPYTLMMEQLMNTAHPRPITPAYLVVSQKFAEAFKAVSFGQDVQKSLDDATKYVEQEMKKYKK